MGLRLTRPAFERLVERALAGVPEEFRQALVNVQIEVKPRPGRESRGLEGKLLGLYFGPPRSELTSPLGSALPPGRIVLYQRNLESLAADEAALEAEVARTLRHEIGHYLGFGEGPLRQAGY